MDIKDVNITFEGFKQLKDGWGMEKILDKKSDVYLQICLKEKYY